MSAVILDFPNLNSALSVYVTALSPPSVCWLVGWFGAGDNLAASLLYQTEYRSKLKLSGSTKSDVVRLVTQAQTQQTKIDTSVSRGDSRCRQTVVCGGNVVRKEITVILTGLSILG